MTDKTTTTYIVYTDDYDWQQDTGGWIESHPDLASARGAAYRYAMNRPGEAYHVAAHMVTFRAETVVKEV